MVGSGGRGPQTLPFGHPTRLNWNLRHRRGDVIQAAGFVAAA